MKRIYLTFVLLITVVILFAQAPRAFIYQAIARDDIGNILSNWKISLRISIVQDGQNGNVVYSETQRVTSNMYGLINLVIGEGVVQDGNFESINWGSSSFYIKMEMDTGNGTDFKNMGSTQLYAVPYALYAEQAGTLVGSEENKPTTTQTQPHTKLKSTQGNRPPGIPNSSFPADTSSYMNVNAGSVGIGTIDPQEKLDVIGKIKSNAMILVDDNGHQWEIMADITEGILFISLFQQCGDSLYDSRNGQYYQTVLIDAQCWMAENLNVGAMIFSITGGQEQTSNSLIEKYCFDNDPAQCDIYGGLYEWDEAMQYLTTPGTQGICPDGWHIPTDTEFNTLSTFLGGDGESGGKMKSTGTVGNDGLWNNPNTDATNSSGFTAFPGGDRVSSTGLFDNIGAKGFFWLSSEYNLTTAWFIYLRNNSGEGVISTDQKTFGLSVRCVMDE